MQPATRLTFVSAHLFGLTREVRKDNQQAFKLGYACRPNFSSGLHSCTVSGAQLHIVKLYFCYICPKKNKEKILLFLH